MEKSCGCIVFNDEKVLIVQSLKGVYGFPKGHVEEGETLEQTAIRETKEETGITAEIIDKTKFTISYNIKENINKEVIFFLAKTKDSKIKRQEEEIKDVKWVEKEKVKDILTFDNLKELWCDIYNKYEEDHNDKINI